MRTHFDSDHNKRSWWTIEPAWIDPNNYIIQSGRKPLMRRINRIYHNCAGHDACEECMQAAAWVSLMFCAIAIVGVRNRMSAIRVMVMHMRTSNTAVRPRRGKGRWYDPGELGNHE